eukprot:symbB.v1.2.000960.t1/scaffold39.1/size394969/4
MVAASQGFLPVGDSEIRICQPLSSEAIWRSFPAARKKHSMPAVEPKKKKLRPNERFAPPRMPVEMVDEDAETKPPPQESIPKMASGPTPEAQKAAPLPQLPPEPPRPDPFEAGADASEEDLQVVQGEAKVAKEMSELLEQPFSKQKKALKAIRLQWHPDKNPENAAVATRVFQFVQAHETWVCFEFEDQKQSQTSEPEVVTELKRLDEQILEAKKDYEREVQKLRLQYQARQTPLLEQRDKVLCDTNGSEDPLTGTPALKGFWVTAMMNHPAFEDDIESHDIPVLEYLRTIEAEDLDKNDSDKGFRVMFHFAENPYFTNSLFGYRENGLQGLESCGYSQ